MPTDLVMWTKNGQDTLLEVLRTINNVIPKDVVGQRIIIDDESTDHTKSIATFLGWKVIRNEGKGIADAANTALKNVTAETFCSFEQDVILSQDWWNKVSPMLNRDVMVASGVRVPYPSKTLHDITMYEIARQQTDQLDLFHPTGWQFGMSLDNTIYNTEYIRSIGGFQTQQGIAVDRLLANRVFFFGKTWAVNYDVQSKHIRKSVWNDLQHYYWYGKNEHHVTGYFATLLGLSGRALFSPIRGAEIAFFQNNPRCFFVYPAIRFASLAGALKELTECW
jgi:glycosyltransferase involved in cell wall biosynthesis